MASMTQYTTGFLVLQPRTRKPSASSASIPKHAAATANPTLWHLQAEKDPSKYRWCIPSHLVSWVSDANLSSLQCDQTRPQCGQCMKGRRRCVKSNLSIISNWTVKSNSAQSGVISSPDSYIRTNSEHTAILQLPLGCIALPPEHPGLMELWGHFLRLQLPKTRNSPPKDNPIMSTTYSLWPSLAQLDRNYVPLRYALAAVASARVGRSFWADLLT